jgi:hypothetical protein
MEQEKKLTTAAVELSDVIEGLRSELQKAQDKGKDKNLRFGVNNIELELDLTIAKKVSGKGAGTLKVDTGEGLVKYLVGKINTEGTVGVEGEYQRVSTQKITLSLSAESSDGKKARLSGTR